MGKVLRIIQPWELLKGSITWLPVSHLGHFFFQKLHQSTFMMGKINLDDIDNDSSLLGVHLKTV